MKPFIMVTYSLLLDFMTIKYIWFKTKLISQLHALLATESDNPAKAENISKLLFRIILLR